MIERQINDPRIGQEKLIGMADATKASYSGNRPASKFQLNLNQMKSWTFHHSLLIIKPKH